MRWCGMAWFCAVTVLRCEAAQRLSPAWYCNEWQRYRNVERCREDITRPA